MTDVDISIPGSVVNLLLRRIRSGVTRPSPDEGTASDWNAMADAVKAAAARRRKAGRPIRVTLSDRALERLCDELVRAKGQARSSAVLAQLTRIARRIRHRLRTGEWPKPRPRKKPEDAWPDEVRAEAEAVALEAARLCWRVARRKSSDLGLPSDWKPSVLLSWNGQRSSSWGGKRKSGHYGGHGGISLVLAHYVPKDGKGGGRFREYSHIASEPAIGSFTTGDWRNLVRALVAHEIAHAAQFWINRHGKFGRHSRIDYRRTHGDGFKRIYALLRRETVNPLLQAERNASKAEDEPSREPAPA